MRGSAASLVGFTVTFMCHTLTSCLLLPWILPCSPAHPAGRRLHIKPLPLLRAQPGSQRHQAEGAGGAGADLMHVGSRGNSSGTIWWQMRGAG